MPAKKKTPEHGGAREGSGRPSARGGKTDMVNARVLVEAKEKLIEQAASAGKSLSAYVADILEAHALKQS